MHIILYLLVVRQENKIIGLTSRALAIGDTMKIQCLSHCSPKWFFKKHINNSDVLLISGKWVLKIKPIHRSHTGVYYCYGCTETLTYFLNEQEIIVYSKFCSSFFNCDYFQ